MLHADIAILDPAGSGPGDVFRPGPGGVTLFTKDGQQVGIQGHVSHWNMGRRLLDRVRPRDSRTSLKTTSDPGSDDTVRRWYLATCAFMLRISRVEPAHFDRALELFPIDPDLLFFAGSAHEVFAGVRTQSAIRSMDAPRGVTFDVREEGAELRLAEQLYKRALERNPRLVEARIRLGRVLGRRGRHEEAIDQLRQGRAAEAPVLQFYAHLFLADGFEALGKDDEARQSYEQAAALAPTAQSALFGLSRIAEKAGDRAAARELIARVVKLPPSEEARPDPWWVYEIVQARGVDGLLADLRQRIASLATR
jgi:tetratricopeptide (TPR) repeat protein